MRALKQTLLYPILEDNMMIELIMDLMRLCSSVLLHGVDYKANIYGVHSMECLNYQLHWIKKNELLNDYDSFGHYSSDLAKVRIGRIMIYLWVTFIIHFIVQLFLPLIMIYS